jgi:pimeloyl-ACP methyl ester carboxylesterase
MFVNISRRFTACVSLLCLAASTSWAATITFKDGYTITGRVRSSGGFELDKGSGQPVWMPTGGMALDTGARVVFFSHSQVLQVEPKDPNPDEASLRLLNLKSRTSALEMYPLVHILESTPWDQRWERQFKLQAAVGLIGIDQRLAILTPQDARVDAKRFAWTSWYLTTELGPETVHELLSNHPDLKSKGDAGDFARRMRIYRFLAQAGWRSEADQELTAIQKDFPAEKEKVDAARQELRKLEAVERWQAIERGHRAGRHDWVAKQLAEFPADVLSESLQGEDRTLKATYESTNGNIKLAARFLEQLPDAVGQTGPAWMRDAAKTIRSELNFENVSRLEVFLNFAQQAENDRAQAHKPENGPAELLAFAVSGWLLGKDSAEAKVESAERLWAGRAFLKNYLTTEDAGVRAAFLKQYQSKKPAALAIDEMSQVIKMLPPVEPLALGGGSPLQLHAPTQTGRKKIDYWLQLPPEYAHSQAYPVVIALADGKEKPRAMLDRLGPQAAENGYILAVPDWPMPMEDLYGYSPAEHAAVLDTLRDLRQRLRVDSDRVFLTGYGQGGNMALDVGLAHPDQFAGVIPVCGDTRRHASRYYNNAQYLPLYVVDGDFDGDNLKNVRPLLDKWTTRGYPTLFVDYKGRGHEWFEGEVPYLFDWMNHKSGLHKRATGLPQLGVNGMGGPLGQEFQTMRATDNRFYWISSNSIAERNLNPQAGRWNPALLPATIQGRVAEGNQIIVYERGLNEVTIRLGRDMIDFNKPLTVRINGKIRMANRKAIPSIATMLEELYADRDRERLVWAKLEFSRP